MVSWANSEIGGIIKAAQDYAAKKAPAESRENLTRFIGQFYAGGPPEDLKGRSPETLYNAAAAAWETMQSRQPGTVKVRIVQGKGAGAPDRTALIVVNDDMPFLVDSVICEMERMEETPLLAIHPIVTVNRDAAGKLLGLADSDGNSSSGAGRITESVMHVEFSEQTDPDQLDRIKDNITSVLNDVRLAVRDWAAMRRHAGRLAADFDGPGPGVDAAQAEEAADFLRWLHDDHYTFIGYRRYAFESRAGKTVANIDRDQSLGVLIKQQIGIFEGLSDGGEVPAKFNDYLKREAVLLIVKANQRATVHRRVHYDVVAIKIFDAAGKVIGVHMFVGLFTADVYTNSPSFVPVLRRKIERIRASVGFQKHSHDGKLLEIREFRPTSAQPGDTTTLVSRRGALGMPYYAQR